MIKPFFCLSKKEVEALDYFLKQSGYISYEFHSEIHELRKRIIQYLKDDNE